MMTKQEILDRLESQRILVYSADISNLEGKVHGVTVSRTRDDRDLFVVLINSGIPEDVQENAFKHEILHIAAGHFYSDRPEDELEAEVMKQQDAGFPCFTGWNMETVYKRYRRERNVPECPGA